LGNANENIVPPEEDDRIAELLKPMLKKKLFVALSKAVVPPEQILPFVPEHLEYMNQLENQGKLFASGRSFKKAFWSATA
jgi:hypothetical protein